MKHGQGVADWRWCGRFAEWNASFTGHGSVGCDACQEILLRSTTPIFWILVLLGPLAMFTRHLWRANREGQREYGLLASRYLAEFRKKWTLGVNPNGEELLGSSDIQSLADMANSYDVVRRMRLVPFGLREISILAAVTLAPLLPLTLTAYSLDQI